MIPPSHLTKFDSCYSLNPLCCSRSTSRCVLSVMPDICHGHIAQYRLARARTRVFIWSLVLWQRLVSVFLLFLSPSLISTTCMEGGEQKARCVPFCPASVSHMALLSREHHWLGRTVGPQAVVNEWFRYSCDATGALEIGASPGCQCSKCVAARVGVHTHGHLFIAPRIAGVCAHAVCLRRASLPSAHKMRERGERSKETRFPSLLHSHVWIHTQL